MARGIPSDVIKHFQAIPLFANVSKKHLRAIIAAATEVDVKAGTVLVREGGTDRDLFVILRGEAAVTQKAKRLTTLGTGDFFGELAFLDHSPRTATVTATTDMRVVVVGAREIGDVIEKDPVVAQRMLATLAQRVRQNERSAQH